MTLPKFLLARLDEDYEIAWGAEPSPWREGEWDGRTDGPREVLGRHGDVTAVCYYGGTYGHVLHFNPTRVLADIEAKRQIVELYLSREAQAHEHNAVAAHATGLLLAIRQLAAVYADHADYRQEWKP